MNKAVLDGLLDEVIAARVRGDTTAAIEGSQRLLAMVDAQDSFHYGWAHGELGAAFLFVVRDFAQAERHYREAVAVLPRSVIVSRGLFHSLFNQGRCVDALREVLRLVTLRDSAVYRDLLTDDVVDGFPPDARAIAKEAQRVLASWN